MYSQYIFNFAKAVQWYDNLGFWKIKLLGFHLLICTLGQFVTFMISQNFGGVVF